MPCARRCWGLGAGCGDRVPALGTSMAAHQSKGRAERQEAQEMAVASGDRWVLGGMKVCGRLRC